MPVGWHGAKAIRAWWLKLPIQGNKAGRQAQGGKCNVCRHACQWVGKVKFMSTDTHRRWQVGAGRWGRANGVGGGRQQHRRECPHHPTPTRAPSSALPCPVHPILQPKPKCQKVPCEVSGSQNICFSSSRWASKRSLCSCWGMVRWNEGGWG